MSKVKIRLSDGTEFEHDFGCNNHYAEMFQMIREIIGIDSRVKWFKDLKDEFYNIQCFGDVKVDISKTNLKKHHHASECLDCRAPTVFAMTINASVLAIVDVR